MKKNLLQPLSAVFTFFIGITAAFLYSTLPSSSTPAPAMTVDPSFNRKTRLNGNLEAHHVGSLKPGDLTTEKFFVINNSPDTALYLDFAKQGLKNQTAVWLRKNSGGEPRYIGKGASFFCPVGAGNVNRTDFEQKLLSGEAVEFEVEIDEESPRYEVGFSFWTADRTKESIVWATVDRRRAMPVGSAAQN